MSAGLTEAWIIICHYCS